MNTHFDPYHVWLGISPEEQPCDYYRLLGIRKYEQHPDVIDGAADRQMAHVRNFQNSYPEAATHLLNQLTTARVCLLNAKQKQDYDRSLSQQVMLTPEESEPNALPLPTAGALTIHPSGYFLTLLFLSVTSVIGTCVLLVVMGVALRVHLLKMIDLQDLVQHGPIHMARDSSSSVQQRQQEAANRLGMPVRFENTLGMKFSFIPAGTVKSNQELTIRKPFYLSIFEVTQEQYIRVMGKNPSVFKGAQNPVEAVRWNEAAEFCRRLSEQEGRTYRLPTQVEAEYACRATTMTEYSFGDDALELGEYAWFEENSGKKTHPVGQKKPNLWGLYDMHGNVEEWCQDWQKDSPAGQVTDPKGRFKVSDRVFRGGSWDDSAWLCRSSTHVRFYPWFRSNDLGFRVAMVPPQRNSE